MMASTFVVDVDVDVDVDVIVIVIFKASNAKDRTPIAMMCARVVSVWLLF